MLVRNTVKTRAMYYARISIDKNRNIVTRGFASVGGGLASLWTNDTSDATVTVLAVGYVAGAALVGEGAATTAIVVETGADGVGCYAGDLVSCTSMMTPMVDDIYQVGKVGKQAKEGVEETVEILGKNADELGEIVPKGARPLGEWGESMLKIHLNGAGGKITTPFKTSKGNRYIDRMVDGIAHEAKAGVNVGLTPTIENQILKDAELDFCR